MFAREPSQSVLLLTLSPFPKVFKMTGEPPTKNSKWVMVPY